MKLYYRNRLGIKQIDSLESRTEFNDGVMVSHIYTVLLNGEKKRVLTFNNILDSMKFSNYMDSIAKRFNDGEFKDENRFSPALSLNGDLYLNEVAILKALEIEVDE